MPCISYYLGRLLGITGDEGLQEALNHLVCEARLYVTPTHLDIVMSMDDVSMAARTSGLDRNPGWMPRFGKVITYYFE
jgi:hypothetical protein